MSWESLPARQRGPESVLQKTPVTCSSGQFLIGKVMFSRLYITLRPALLGDGAGWIVPGAHVDILVGRAEHAGKLRIIKDGPHWFGKSGGKVQQPVLSLSNFAGLVPGRHMPEPVEIALGAGYLVLTLPDWACQQAAEAPEAPPPTPRQIAAAIEAPKPPAPLAATNKDNPVEATVSEITVWAKRYAIYYNGGNIGVVNKKRRELNLPNFVQVASKAA